MITVECFDSVFREQYPAIDIEASISRLAPQIMDSDTQRRVQQFRKSYSLYQQNRDLINVGAYQPGSDPEIDLAIQMQPALMQFLSQDMNQAVTLNESYTQLQQLIDRHQATRQAAVQSANAMNNPASANTGNR